MHLKARLPSVGETSRSRCNRAARLPGPRRQKVPLHRRAWALACHTRIRAGSPRQRACTWNPTIAGDRPPRYEKKRHFTVGRGPVPRHAAVYRKLAEDRPPRYGHIETRRSLLPEIKPRGLFYRHASRPETAFFLKAVENNLTYFTKCSIINDSF